MTSPYPVHANIGMRFPTSDRNGKAQPRLILPRLPNFPLFTSDVLGAQLVLWADNAGGGSFLSSLTSSTRAQPFPAPTWEAISVAECGLSTGVHEKADLTERRWRQLWNFCNAFGLKKMVKA